MTQNENPDVMPLQGIKGLSPMIAFEHFNCVRSYCIDYMHNVLLGVLKHLLNKWLDAKFKKEAFYIGNFIATIEERLRSNKQPKEMTRLPTNIAKYGQWKASQCRSFLLYYGYGALDGILPDLYLNHFLLLSTSIYTFLQDNITKDEFLIAEQNLKKFVNSFENLYGESRVKFNVHNVLHLSKKVLDCGPLHCYSLFPFESKNGQVVKFIHGGRRDIPEIANKFVHYQIGKR